MRVLCLGGNVCLGARTIRGWPEYLWELTGWQGTNAATPGGRMIDVVRRVSSVPSDVPTWVVVQAGTYDARGGGISPREWGLILDQALDNIADRWAGARILVCSPPAIYPSKVRGFNRHARRWVPRAAKVSREVAEDRGSAWLDLTDMSLEHLPDGIHPNGPGCREIAERVRLELA